MDDRRPLNSGRIFRRMLQAWPRVSRRRVSLVVGVAVGVLGVHGTPAARGQSSEQSSTSSAPAAVPAAAPAAISPTPLVTTGFAIPAGQLDFASASLFHACESVFLREFGRSGTDTATAAATALYPLDSARLVPLPERAVTAARTCLRRIEQHGDTTHVGAAGGAQHTPGAISTPLNGVPPVEWPFVLRLAVAANDDSLVQAIVTRQLAAAGTPSGMRAQVLEQIVLLLLRNHWNEGTLDHRTPSHDALARAYAAQLDTLAPAGPVLATRLRVETELYERAPIWDVDAELAHLRARHHLAQSIPLEEIPASDRATIAALRTGPDVDLARALYLKTPTRANFLKFLAVRDSSAHLPPGYSVDSTILGQPAGLIDGYWFNTPPGIDHPVVPAPGTVTLLVFVDLAEGRTLGPDMRAMADQLRRIHARYPALQVVTVSEIRGRFQGKEFQDRPQEEAARMADFVAHELRIPGMFCVLPLQYHSEPGLSAVPLPSPVLDHYRLDPRNINGFFFFVDREGWIVQTNEDVLNGHFIQRLLVP